MDNLSAPRQKLVVPALGRAVAVLDLLAEETGPLRLSELSQRLQIAKSTLHGLCETLVRLGLLQVEAGGFALGPHVLQWSAAYLGRNDLVRAFDHLMTQDMRLADYTVTLSVLDQADVVYIGCRNSVRPLGFTFRTGMRVPAVFSATGKAILSTLATAARQAILPTTWPEAFTPASVSDAQSLETQLDEAAARGFALDCGEIRVGMVCVGVPIREAGGAVAAGLAISMTEAEAEMHGPAHFAEIARDLASRLAFHNP
ncbi:MAG TPA: IclR family transcriptional regulator [Paracoccus sp. (in: a-proteobacteria)]|uniref:IclR family transcriptional regulator n=1 Tax=Paracoccus sp. TaxID=267 RepID=UPI002C177F1F|nr:IclR family transcriptional regulator [Paracoccus sp. (in: a-proteobacteria)]HWL55587.1 IclR family transcriptional regulator [Paracoccus sp. (in: a-proteobacteria)]